MSPFWQNFRKYATTRFVALLFLVVGVVIVALGYQFTVDGFDLRTLIGEIYSNLGIEFVSIAITVLVVDRLNQRQSLLDRKSELILQMGSPDHAFANEAVRILRQKGWLMDGSLRGAALDKANLAGADLSYADLRGVQLVGANLKDAQLNSANLRDASLGFAQLQGATLRGANLEHTRFGGANLENADLTHTNMSDGEAFSADLRGARLQGATLQETRLRGAKFDEKTVLPCGNCWSHSTDFRKYTQPDQWAAEQAR